MLQYVKIFQVKFLGCQMRVYLGADLTIIA